MGSAGVAVRLLESAALVAVLDVAAAVDVAAAAAAAVVVAAAAAAAVAVVVVAAGSEQVKGRRYHQMLGMVASCHTSEVNREQDRLNSNKASKIPQTQYLPFRMNKLMAFFFNPHRDNSQLNLEKEHILSK